MGKQIWRFEVRAGSEEDFVSINKNDWPALFGRSNDYGGTVLGRNVTHPRVYVTMDTWTSKDAFDKFVIANQRDFDELCERHEGLCDAFTEIGFYDF